LSAPILILIVLILNFVAIGIIEMSAGESFAFFWYLLILAADVYAFGNLVKMIGAKK
jgi:hypothetical protein